MSTRVLVVDDEPTLLSTMRFNLGAEGYDVLTAADAESALEAARQGSPDLIILDLMLPGMHGFEVCRVLRKETNVPIIILTAKTDEIDKVVALELGADDYMTKPFSMKELIARVRARLRRSEESAVAEQDEVLRAGDIVVDVSRREASKNGSTLELKRREFELLVLLMRSRGRVLTREELLRSVWDYEPYGETRTVDVHIGRLRRKIEADPEHPVHIITSRGIGYSFNA
jgi:two-component system alkaline phosphatase synthesis response regulator PhoP